MNRFFIALAVLLAGIVSAGAQQANVVATCGSITYSPAGTPRPITQDVNGNQCTSAGGSGATAGQVQGNSASGATDTGNPVKTGAVYNVSPITVATGQRVDAQADTYGNLHTRLIGTAATGADGLVNTLIMGSASNNLSSRPLAMVGHAWNGASFDRIRGDTQGQWHNQSYSASSSVAATPVATTAAANNLVLKASAGNFYNVQASNHTATAGFLVLLNVTASPADGAITPLHCQALPANGNASIAFTAPARYSTGITAVLTSAATCFTKTTGVITGFISGIVQ